MSDKKYSPTLNTLQEFLEKARRRLSDEEADVWDRSDEESLGLEEDLREEDEDEASKWLLANDPKLKGGKLDDEPEEEEDEPSDDDPWYDHEASLKAKIEAKKKKLATQKKGKKEEAKKEKSEPAPPAEAAPKPEEKKQVGPMVRRKAEPAAPPASAPAPAVEEKKPAAPVVVRKPSAEAQKVEETLAAMRAKRADAPAPPPAAAAAAPASAPAPAAAAAAPASDARRIIVPRASRAPASTISREYDPRNENELQPTRAEILAMREYTRPWEQRARDRTRLEARPDVNPHLHHHGRVVEARNITHADRHKAYNEFINSPDYQNADPITQMEMETEWEKNWHAQNPDHLKTALQVQHQAHKKGAAAKDLFLRAKDEKIRHIASGGAQAGAMSVEEGLQHLGQGDREEDEAPTGISQDRAASFAVGNKEFLEQYMKRYNERGPRRGTGSNVDLDTFNDEARADAAHVLGEHPALNDPTKKAMVDKFVARYYPVIQKAKRRVIQKLGLQDHVSSGQIDEGILDYAGMHALYQAVNDYDHDHQSKASFVTHLNRKMHGLMQIALKTQDEIPEDLRVQAKKFDQKTRAASASPVKHIDKAGNVSMLNADGTPHVPPAPAPAAPSASTEPAAPPAPAKPVAPVVRRASHEIAASHPPEVQERLKRIAAAKPMVRKPSAQPASPMKPKKNFTITNLDDEGGDY